MTTLKAFAVFSLCLLLLVGAPLNSLARTTDDLVAEAWRALQENNQTVAEAKLTAALKQDPTNARASLALFFLYRLQWKYQAA